MLETIAEQIRQQLATLDWITRTGGLTNPVEILDGETAKTIPACLSYEGAPCDAGSEGDFLNMAPHGEEVCIAFVEMPNDFSVVRRHARYDDVTLAFRVVVWYDARKISFDGDLEPSWKMIEQIIGAVKAADVTNDALGGAKIRFNSTQFTPDQIWSRYNMRDANQGFFMYPYRTFGLNFILQCRLNLSCFDGTLTANANAC